MFAIRGKVVDRDLIEYSKLMLATMANFCLFPQSNAVCAVTEVSAEQMPRRTMNPVRKLLLLEL